MTGLMTGLVDLKFGVIPGSFQMNFLEKLNSCVRSRLWCLGILNVGESLQEVILIYLFKVY